MMILSEKEEVLSVCTLHPKATAMNYCSALITVSMSLGTHPGELMDAWFSLASCEVSDGEEAQILKYLSVSEIGLSLRL
jgi:hypothetical protein